MADESNAGHLEVDSVSNGCCVVVRLVGEVDIASVDQVRAATREARDRDGALHLIVDCERLDFLDSSGVKALLDAHHSFDGKLAFVRPRRVVTRVLEVTGLHEVFEVADGLEAATEAVHRM